MQKRCPIAAHLSKGRMPNAQYCPTGLQKHTFQAAPWNYQAKKNKCAQVGKSELDPARAHEHTLQAAPLVCQDARDVCGRDVKLHGTLWDIQALIQQLRLTWREMKVKYGASMQGRTNDEQEG
eukprot:1011732-Pelagomonas_calceolata.AAC.1